MTIRQFLLAGLGTVILAGAAPPASRSTHYGQWGLDMTAMDTSVRPGDDFNRFASGAWLARTEIPQDKALQTLRMAMSDVTEGQLNEILSDAADHASSDPLRAKVGAFYRAYMDEARIAKLGLAPLRPELEAVRAARSRSDLAALMGHGQDDFEGSLFSLTPDVDQKDVRHYAVYLGQAGLGMPDRDYYLAASFQAQENAYMAYISTLLNRAGWPRSDEAASEVVKFETEIATASWTKAAQRDPATTYNAMRTRDLSSFAPGFDWAAYFKAAGLGHVPHIVVREKTAIPRIAAIFAKTPISTLKAWQTFNILDNAAFYLPPSFAGPRFEFRNHILAGQPGRPARWKDAIRAVSGGDCGTTDDRVDCFGSMGYAVGQLYTARYFPAASRRMIEELVANLRTAMRDRLEHLDWMSATTKIEALRKLDTYRIKVGYPDHPRAYGGLVIRSDDLIGDVRRAGAHDWVFNVGRLDKPVDRDDWAMTPQTNDAYNGSLRDIVFPAAILQPPVFDPDADPAINYGAIGAIIGHELTHGFDDQGRQYDADGALRDWWAPSDASAFKARARRLSVQYSSYEPVPGSKINGDLTLGENIADLGGLNIALEAYHRSLGGKPAPVISRLTGDQRFFLGWAQAWRGKARDEYVRKQVVSDPHSPRAFRVNGPTRNIDAWYDAFAVAPHDRSYLPPAERVRIW